MIEMFKTLHNTPITNDGVYMMFAVIAVAVLLIVSVAVRDWVVVRRLRKASRKTSGLFIGSTHIWLSR